MRKEVGNIRVYVAGKYNDKNIISILDNIRLGIRTCTELLLKGFAPFCPWLDYQFSLVLREGEHIEKEIYHKYSLSWLEVSDCILVLSNYKKSRGALREIEKAKELNIPIFYSIDKLEDFNLPKFKDIIGLFKDKEKKEE